MWAVAVAAATGAIVVAGICTATAAAGTDAAPHTTLTSYMGRRGLQLVVEIGSQELTLYNFSKDHGKSNCYGTCQKTWWPLIARGSVVATPGSHIKTGQLGTVKRRDGSRQVTYYGQPLYRYHDDATTGQMRGVDKFQFGGSWGVIGVNGGVLGRPGY